MVKVKEEPDAGQEPIVIDLISDSEDEDTNPVPKKSPKIALGATASVPSPELQRLRDANAFQRDPSPQIEPQDIREEVRNQLLQEEQLGSSANGSTVGSATAREAIRPLQTPGPIHHNRASSAPETNSDWLSTLLQASTSKPRPKPLTIGPKKVLTEEERNGIHTPALSPLESLPPSTISEPPTPTSRSRPASLHQSPLASPLMAAPGYEELSSSLSEAGGVQSFAFRGRLPPLTPRAGNVDEPIVIDDTNDEDELGTEEVEYEEEVQLAGRVAPKSLSSANKS